MALTLKESTALSELATLLYDFLPGSGRDQWKGHVTFKSVAESVGVGQYWVGGSKKPALTRLLERTLQHERRFFERLVVEIVRAGITYRKKNRTPIAPAEIECINAQILLLGFKFPDLWDRDFGASLADDSGALAKARVEQQRAAEQLRETALSGRSVALDKLRADFIALHAISDRQKAGLQLEKLLNQLFALNELSPREPFRVVGEQIDGSFELDHEIYLFEAKWQSEPRPAADLYVFRVKIEGKSGFTRGVFLSINGISDEARSAITSGKQPLFFVMDGYDLMMALENKVSLADFFRRRQRLLAERGHVSLTFHECGF